MSPQSDYPLLADLLRDAVRSTNHLLTTSRGWDRLALRPGETHVGDDPIVVDAEAQEVFEQAVRAHPYHGRLNIIDIVGEERFGEPKPQEGERVIVVDPLDGSKPWTMGRFGYCVAAIVLKAEEAGKLTVDAAIIGTPTEAFTLLQTDNLYYGRLADPPERDVLLQSVLPVSDVIPRSLAAVGYKPADRPLFEPIAKQLPDWSIITIGGNPIVPHICTGALTASITLKPASTWDSIGLLMAAATDAVVGDHYGTVVSGPDFRELFAQILLTHENVYAIPELIVAKDHDSYKAVVAAVAAARDDE